MTEHIQQEIEILVADNGELLKKLEVGVIKDAAKADKAEHTMTLMQAFRIHKKAIFWSMALSGAYVLESK